SAGGEAFDGVTRAEFARRAAMGEFALSWEAHGLSYGIPADQLRAVDEGITLLFNGSRGMMEEARAAFPHLKVLLITARDEVLAQRLAERGRESASEISERLSRARMSAPTGAHVIEIDNSGALDQAVAAALAALEPVRG
ncbi:MAG: phosphonate metabolism protein/1,5-bisphosphokinase (PRPP-forming) PhnN, partial [Pseudomonadota bacterium]